tara:strand:+ start:3109 stop:3399 length:291 start_codon:yes stop_codon:yes gene_type:complete
MGKRNLTRKYLSNKINQKIGFSKNFSSKIIDDFFEFLVSGIVHSKKVKISSFGTFKVMDKKERIGRNPKTKIEAKISSRRVVKFKPSLLIKEKINR